MTDEKWKRNCEAPGRFAEWRSKVVYYLFEPFWWSIWYRHPRAIHGNLPDGPFVLVSNHGSYLDWLILGVILQRQFRRPIRFLAKEKLLGNWVFRGLVHASQCVVVREDKKLQAARIAAKIFRQAEPDAMPIVGVFPEGTRSADGQRLPAISGASWIARNGGVPILPVALCGFWEVWPPGRRLPSWRRTRLDIHFLEPVDPKSFSDDQAATDYALNEIYKIVLHQRKEHATGEILR